MESHRKPTESVNRTSGTLAGKMQKRHLVTAEFSGAVKTAQLQCYKLPK